MAVMIRPLRLFYYDLCQFTNFILPIQYLDVSCFDFVTNIKNCIRIWLSDWLIDWLIDLYLVTKHLFRQWWRKSHFSSLAKQTNKQIIFGDKTENKRKIKYLNEKLVRYKESELKSERSLVSFFYLKPKKGKLPLIITLNRILL